MTVFVALLRAVNVGGTGKLAMSDLRAWCEDAGLVDARTYIQTGNVVFRSERSAADVAAALEDVLAARTGRRVDVLVRSAEELEAALARNPFPDAAPNRVAVVFLPTALAADALDDVRVPGREEIVPRGREVFVHYPDGMGRSKLKLPFASEGTARNVNTVAKLVEMTRT